MNIDKEKIKVAFKEKDYDYLFEQAREITDFLLVQKFKITDDEERKDWSSECLANLWLKITQNKVKEDQNIFSFIWQNSTFRILEMLRRKTSREKKIKFISYDSVIGDLDFKNYVDFQAFINS